ncbi:MAG TPA: TAXI family TRAP transporter solute-binding subunit [Alphaproteobacteria bacterium]|nr:TAXI family TRAP transporter solute-binding subunit [Alphaproteobacteria bacterium]
MRKFAVAVAILVLGGGLAGAAEFVTILTGGTSGIYYPLGVALSKIYGEGIAGSKTQVQSTKASVENLNLLQQGRGEVAFTLGDTLSLAWAGSEEAGFKGKLDKLRGLSALYPNYIQIVASEDSAIRSLADLKGKRISVGAPKSGTELNARAVLGAAGMSYQDLGKVEYLPFGESVELIKNRQLDATLQSVGLGAASIRDLAASVPIVIVAIPEEVVAKIGDPAYIARTIPAGTYEGQDEDVPTAAVINYLVTHADIGEETAYLMTKLLHENKDQLVAAHAAAKGIDPSKATEGMPVPLHPGAERYYKETGLIK